MAVVPEPWPGTSHEWPGLPAAHPLSQRLAPPLACACLRGQPVAVMPGPAAQTGSDTALELTRAFLQTVDSSRADTVLLQANTLT